MKYWFFNGLIHDIYSSYQFRKSEIANEIKMKNIRFMIFFEEAAYIKKVMCDEKEIVCCT